MYSNIFFVQMRMTIKEENNYKNQTFLSVVPFLIFFRISALLQLQYKTTCFVQMRMTIMSSANNLMNKYCDTWHIMHLISPSFFLPSKFEWVVVCTYRLSPGILTRKHQTSQYLLFQFSHKRPITPITKIKQNLKQVISIGIVHDLRSTISPGPYY
jgi:hypothetical protein